MTVENKYNPEYRRKYNIAIRFGLVLIFISIAIYTFMPAPQAMDVPRPESWELTKNVCATLIIVGSTILWLTGAVGFVYSDSLWQGIGYIRYIIAILFGLPVSLIFALGYFL